VARRPDLAVLAVLALAGVALRLWLMLRWRPAFLGFSDSYVYLTNSSEGFFNDSLRPVGYPLFLAGARSLSSSLSATTLLQHAMGVASAGFAYLAGRRLGLGRWAALLPAAVLLLHGATMWFEHAILTESLFGFLVCAGLLAAALAAGGAGGPRAQIALAGAAGLLVAGAGAVRTVGIALLPVLAAWLAWALPAPARRRVAAAGATALAGVALLAGNLVWAHSETGAYAFSRHDYYLAYGRVAPFADCGRFTPPRGTRALCPTVPRRDRFGPGWWVFSPESAIVRAFGRVDRDVQPPGAARRTSAFYRRAILSQPLDYLSAVGRDLVRFVDPNFPLNPNPAIGNGGAGVSADDYQEHLLTRSEWSRGNEPGTAAVVARLYSTPGLYKGPMEGLRRYEGATRLTGVPMVLLIALALAGPLAASGRRRRGAVLATAVGATLAVAPVLAHEYDWRYAVAALGPLALAAAFGAEGIADRVRAIRLARLGEPSRAS
jgi:hypothetical protein